MEMMRVVEYVWRRWGEGERARRFLIGDIRAGIYRIKEA